MRRTGSRASGASSGLERDWIRGVTEVVHRRLSRTGSSWKACAEMSGDKLDDSMNIVASGFTTMIDPGWTPIII